MRELRVSGEPSNVASCHQPLPRGRVGTASARATATGYSTGPACGGRAGVRAGLRCAERPGGAPCVRPMLPPPGPLSYCWQAWVFSRIACATSSSVYAMAARPSPMASVCLSSPHRAAACSAVRFARAPTYSCRPWRKPLPMPPVRPTVPAPPPPRRHRTSVASAAVGSHGSRITPHVRSPDPCGDGRARRTG